MSISANIHTFNINTENEISIILSHFETRFVIDLITKNIEAMRMSIFTSGPNLVDAFEQQMKVIKDRYNDNEAEINDVRNKTYMEIINILCNTYDISINFDNIPNQDYYSVARNLYDFLVSNFKRNIVNFFTLYIRKEKNSIYEIMNLADFKKNKDSTTLYNKKLYKDAKLAIINSNLDHVIFNMATFPISLEDIINICYQKPLAEFLNSIIIENNNFFLNSFIGFLNSTYGINTFSDIRLQINSFCIEYDDMQKFCKPE